MDNKYALPHLTPLQCPLVSQRHQISCVSSLDHAASFNPKPGGHSLSNVDGPLCPDTYTPLHGRHSLMPWPVTPSGSTVSPRASPTIRPLDTTLFGVNNPYIPFSELQVHQDIPPPPTLLDTTQWASSGILTDLHHASAVTQHGICLPPNCAMPHSFAGYKITPSPEGYISFGELAHSSHDTFITAGNTELGGVGVMPGLQPLPIIPSLQLGSIYSSASPSSMNAVTIGNNPTSSNHTMLAPPASSYSGQPANAVADWPQRPAFLYHVLPKKGPSRRRGRRGRAINVDGLWIDEEDLLYGTTEASGLISVHECQWSKSNNPCGMWIIGTKAFVGSHIRKWHNSRRKDRHATRCQWHDCDTRGMLKDSINRHVVTVHLGEVFFCKGCGEESPRQDVYEQHVEHNEGCRGAGTVVTYQTEMKMISAHEALKRGGAVRDA
ncbi:hypothetical protein BS17DRAFT_185176 [Gyrodon lividus]|nr:hypothetical protein BS17DRAFT_185176 [Gyrodon lividus]